MKRVVTAVLAALCVAGPTTTYADVDYEVRGRDWNGLGDLVALGHEARIEVDTPARVDLEALRAGDGLLLVYPTSELPRAALLAFLRRGGHVGLADDFGTGSTLFAAFGIERAPPRPVALDRRLRGNRNVLVATARAAHPLTRDVRALVANHPQALRHPSLSPLVAIGDEGDALVLVGTVGAGRLVAIGDASLLINNMLEFRDNRTFARNLLRYLGEHGRVVVAGTATEIVGATSAAERGPALTAFRSGLERLARVRLPPAALTATTLGIAALLLLAAVLALPRRGPYLAATRLGTPAPAAGLVGRAAWYAQPGRDLATPLADLERALEAELADRLALPPETPTARMLDAIAARDRDAAGRTRACFGAIERARRRGRVDARTLRALSEAGRDLLVTLDRLCSPRSS